MHVGRRIIGYCQRTERGPLDLSNQLLQFLAVFPDQNTRSPIKGMRVLLAHFHGGLTQRLHLGRRGRQFESGRPDQYFQHVEAYLWPREIQL